MIQRTILNCLSLIWNTTIAMLVCYSISFIANYQGVKIPISLHIIFYCLVFYPMIHYLIINVPWYVLRRLKNDQGDY